ncbi:hypothetical protein [Paenibacillus tengchongensis]|uniref:hypothetical protein n=1 Tax=Paenibacillus tengchongensis TaxID=2608684 RepID=UPI00124D5088|nr:hypothetical protein [Paenibacillus tengchongensis]
MDWLNEYEADLREAFAASRGIISSFPPPLHAHGLAYLDRFNPFSAGSHKNYICYLLPFWLRTAYPLELRMTRGMSTGNILLMLYFFLQDDLMDTPDSSSADKLPLANLLFTECMNLYRPLFPADSPFWTYFNRYIYEWADSVTGERHRDYFLEDRIRVAHKASPLKLCSTAILLLTDHAADIPEMEELLHEVLVTLQMLDDYEDWEEDFADGSYNCLLSFVRSRAGAGGTELSPEQVREFLLTRSGLAGYADIAAVNDRRITASRLRIPHLADFHRTLSGNLQSIARTLEEDKRLLQDGGLGYWLAKHLKES